MIRYWVHDVTLGDNIEFKTAKSAINWAAKMGAMMKRDMPNYDGKNWQVYAQDRTYKPNKIKEF